MVVLLVLFPIVMLEIRFLSPLTSHYPVPIATFIGNAISVLLLSWPMMPFALLCLNWWLIPEGKNKNGITAIGTLVILLLYMLEIMIFSSIS